MNSNKKGIFYVSSKLYIPYKYFSIRNIVFRNLANLKSEAFYIFCDIVRFEPAREFSKNNTSLIISYFHNIIAN